MAPETVAARPDCCPELLRRRSEEAVSASIHHAALAQQYLTLAQKFTALAEHVAGGVDGLQQVAVQLEREACAPEAAPALVPPVRAGWQPEAGAGAGSGVADGQCRGRHRAVQHDHDGWADRCPPQPHGSE